MCTTVLVGKNASINGATIMGRNDDSGLPLPHIKFLVTPANNNQSGNYVSAINGFTMPLPKKALRYQSCPAMKEDGKGIYGEAGINEANIGMSATESLYGNERVLALDPFVKNGLAEDSLLTVVLPYIHSAKEGVEFTGHLIEKYGSCEGNGIVFSDKNDVWYMEIPCGHHWVASRIPDDMCAVIANQASQQEINFEDAENFLHSPGIQEFVETNHLNPHQEGWNFRQIFGTATSYDMHYNNPRVWSGQTILGLDQSAEDPRSMDFPFLFKANRQVSEADVAQVLSSHYNETKYDPLGEGTALEKTLYRPISIYRTVSSHIIEINSHVAEAASAVLWFNHGVTAFNPFVPFFANATDTSPRYTDTHLTYDENDMFWITRSISALVERSYPQLKTMLATHLNDCQQEMNHHVAKTIDYVSAHPAEDSTEYLTIQNNVIGEWVYEKNRSFMNDLVAAGLDFSKLTFKTYIKNG
ncbi:C69 family dipeptidase [Vagococcus vulneris]|uniref:Dipeptidase n=1 Tax=Vagococcus vulneris TaxID=1977869 RepID=A0A429ZYV4_9ENTE|nr:C69 family dipeptidase [Vagococcus vulneris]RST99132.1 hypothetical protein CBF37_05550 [Vagococcus vulneris]